MQPKEYDAIPVLEDPSLIFDLSRKVIVIAGGGGKMGQQFTRVLARAGARIAVLDQTPEIIERTIGELKRQFPDTVFGYAADMTKLADVTQAFADIRATIGPVTGYIHNVMAKPEGYYRAHDQYDPMTWQNVIAGNLTSAFLGSREAAKDMKQAGGGTIVLTASIYGVVSPDQRIYADCSPRGNTYGGSDPLNAPASYSASKGGIISLARYLATLWGQEKIRVNCLVPGGVYDGQEEAFHQAYCARTPLGRMATWSEYNGAILFLMSDASRYMTGAQLIVDGGWTAW